MTADYISLTCPNCGNKLKIADDMNNFVCTHCRIEHFVKREDGAISLVSLSKSDNEENIDVEKIESKLAIPRLEREIEQFEIELSEIRKRFSTKDCLNIATGFSAYNSFLIAFMRAIEDKYLSLVAAMGIVIGAFVVGLIGMYIITERMEVKPKKEIEKRNHEIDKHKIVLSS